MRNSIHRYRQRDYGEQALIPLPTHNVGDAHAQTSAEDGVAGVVPHGVVEVGFQMPIHITTESHFVDENNGNDNGKIYSCGLPPKSAFFYAFKLGIMHRDQVLSRVKE